MGILLSPVSAPTGQQVIDIMGGLNTIVNLAKQFGLNLSVEQRSNSYKMGPRRYAYAKTAQRLSVQHIDVMPRQFNPADFTANVKLIEDLQMMQSLVDQINERIDDTLMAARIDAMTYTKQVHDSLRLANVTNPAYDTPLADLDEFNTRASAEDTSATGTPSTTPAATTNTPPAA